MEESSCELNLNGKSFRELSSDEKRQRSRERNRIHARKTRQRKKEHMETLHCSILKLQKEGQLLQKSLKELEAVNALASLCFQGLNAPKGSPDICDRFDKLTKAAVMLWMEQNWEIKIEYFSGSLLKLMEESNCMDRQYLCMLSEASNTQNGSVVPSQMNQGRMQIRRERNRMHAKRARDRKKLMIDGCSCIVGMLEACNILLRERINILLSEPALISSPLKRQFVQSKKESFPDDIFDLWDCVSKQCRLLPKLNVPPRFLHNRTSKDVGSMKRRG